MISLVENKKSSYVIVIRKDHSLAEKTAASEFSKYIGLISECIIPIVTDDKASTEHEIVIGFAKRDGADVMRELGDEGFCIRTINEKIYILGSAVRGAIYGVYSFLEKFCDCRFYCDECERVPKKSTICIPNDVCQTETPVFEYRNSYWGVMTRADICAKLKNNGVMGHDGMLVDGKVDSKYGGGIDFNGAFCHTIADLNEQGGDYWHMPCLNDEAVYERCLKNVKANLKANPDKKIISVSQLDGTDGECTCEKCNKVYEEENSHMGNMLRFCNRIQNDIADEFPDAIVDTLAYRYTRKPPEKTVPDKRMIIRLCNIECSFCEPLEDVEDKNDLQTSFVANLKRWNELTDHLYIWDYTTNFTNMTTMFPNFQCLAPNMRLFANNGVKGVFEQGNYTAHNGEFGELRSYLLCKLLWNPYMSDEELRGHMSDFCNDFYGSAAKHIMEYLDLIQGEALHKSYMSIYYDDSSNFLYLDGHGDNIADKLAFYDKASEIFDNAEAAAWAEADKKAYYRVRASRVQLYNYYYFVLKSIENKYKESGEKSEDIEMPLTLDTVRRFMREVNRTSFAIMREQNIDMPREFVRLDFTKTPDFDNYILWWE